MSTEHKNTWNVFGIYEWYSSFLKLYLYARNWMISTILELKQSDTSAILFNKGNAEYWNITRFPPAQPWVLLPTQRTVLCVAFELNQSMTIPSIPLWSNFSRTFADNDIRVVYLTFPSRGNIDGELTRCLLATIMLMEFANEGNNRNYKDCYLVFRHPYDEIQIGCFAWQFYNHLQFNFKIVGTVILHICCLKGIFLKN